MILCANLLCVLLTYFIELWIFSVYSRDFNAVYVQLEKSTVFITLQKHEVQTFKNKNKRTSLRDIFVDHF